MGRKVKRLYDLEIDEVSLVDRAANQHAQVTFTKRDDSMEGPMGIYDEDGTPVSEDELTSGDVVFDEDGQELLYLDDEDAEQLVDEGEIDPDDLFDVDDAEDYANQGELTEVGKAGTGLRYLLRSRGSRFITDEGPQRMKLAYNAGRRYRKNPASEGAQRVIGDIAAEPMMGRAGRAALHAGVYRNQYLAGGAAGAAGLAGAAGGGAYLANRRGEAKKSLGDDVYTQLSKALTDSDRDEVIAKALDLVEDAQQQAYVAQQRIDQLEAQQVIAELVKKADQLGLPVDPEELGVALYELGGVSKRSAAVIEKALVAAANSSLYDEIGQAGDYVDNEVMGMVAGYADQLVGKGDLTHEQAVSALFEANPAAYEQYLTEQLGR